jgi:putative spermidine/putrescine transport system permease protein
LGYFPDHKGNLIEEYKMNRQVDRLSLGKIISLIYLIFVNLFILAPMIVIILASFNSARTFPHPFESFTFSWYKQVFVHDEYVNAMVMSAQVALGASGLATLLGIPLSILFVRHDFPGKEALNSFFMTPLIIPQVVLSISLLLMFSILHVRLSEITLILAHTVIVLPYVLRATIASLSLLDPFLEEAAMNLGANQIQTFLRITLPLIRSGVTAGLVLSFIISFINVPLSIFLSTPGNATLPIRVFATMETKLDPVISAIGALIVYLAFAVSLFLEKVIKLRMIL